MWWSVLPSGGPATTNQDGSMLPRSVVLLGRSTTPIDHGSQRAPDVNHLESHIQTRGGSRRDRSPTGPHDAATALPRCRLSHPAARLTNAARTRLSS